MYDPHARRETALAAKLKERIRQAGPLTIAQYMQACLTDPEHGYYVRKSAIGAAGDFITAPEISQVFGELIGLWCAIAWQSMERPRRISLVELGPGRATLMRDALRAAAIVPQFLESIDLVFVETNTILRIEQERAFATSPVQPRWCTAGDIDDENFLPLQPTIVIANEFLDTRPIRQVVRRGGQWFERLVALDGNGALQFALHDDPLKDFADPGESAAEGDIIELAEPITDLTAPLVRRAANGIPVAGLFIDYGFTELQAGESLQAVRGHRPEHPLTSPGEADLSAHVDFSALAHAFIAAGFAIDGPLTQAEFLGRLGAVERASRLMNANPAKAHDIEMGVARLMAVPGMGDRFKVLGVRSPWLPELPGLERPWGGRSVR